MPYTYLIRCKPTEQLYYGVRFKHKHKFDTEIRKTFDCKKKAELWEAKVLRKMDVLNNDKWINQNINGIHYGMLGRKQTEETKRKISEAKKGKPSWNKGMTCDWMVQANKDRKGKPNTGLYKTYLITDPDGKEYMVKGLVKFCKEHDLNPGNMSSVANGKLNHYKKWKCVYLYK